ncbi:lysylphosphatidylglycerol synthase domain-containing protein [Conexibacter sp. CPCC 206217]|uniref:lysylphosphatidylglycerol synthase domain-containing protein n=1 Tax=Conexibacter sp. CPCC 206217 TaxID=3064574 RepID=UPI0027171242|nr:lysylphosphatidylglycerol synthase domain-containing protein [Conexibacter sp. CPCC 206217]MDO8208790.1 lysylphosphatidylglycerol synthase domain-containing protein [Conexibacter sp. CPCC 206217]
MRIALVSPYSWTYPGGVNRHIEALAGQYLARGHDVRVLAPFDPDDQRSARRHSGARPLARELPDYLVSLGRTLGLRANGAISNLALTPAAALVARRELRSGGYDVVHLHEPVAPAVCWDALLSTDAPLVGTFHVYSEHAVSHGLAALAGARRRMDRLAVRVAVSEAAAWTGRRFWGGRYRVIPNGVDLSPLRPPTPRAPGQPLRIAFVGQPVQRKGLPVLLRAFAALREQVPAHLTMVGVRTEDARMWLDDLRGIEALGQVDDARKRQVLQEADVLCAPSLGGESFGMVLTEAFAAGTPVIASDIAGYRDVVRHEVDGLLIPREDATALAETLRALAVDPTRAQALSGNAAQSAERFAWPGIAERVLEAYDDAIAAPAPEGGLRRLGHKYGLVPADGQPHVPARRLPSLEPAAAGRQRRGRPRIARRGAVVAAAAAGIGLSWRALERIGVDPLTDTLSRASPTWVVTGLALMCLSIVVRSVAWRAILRAALPSLRIRRGDILLGTSVGVLLSATLPARLGEPARALVVSRRIGGRRRDVLPTVAGTIVSQTLLNVVALALLGGVTVASLGLSGGRGGVLIAVVVAPLALVAAVLLGPVLLRARAPWRRVRGAEASLRAAVTRAREGLRVFRNPRLGVEAAAMQLLAWGIQWSSCYVLLVALGLDAHVGPAAAAAVLFAVNVTAAVPITPSNIGVFQAACVAVLTAGYGLSYADALAYGIVLQVVELATALVLGVPALITTGLSWNDVRPRAPHAAPGRPSLGAE